MKLLKSIFVLFFLVFSGESLFAQSWDYEKYPLMNVELLHLDADLRISEDGLIEGDVLYEARIKNERADSVRLHSSGLNILLVSVNGEVLDYRISDDELIIYLENSYKTGEHIQLRIQYDTEPQFGVHMNSNGTIWTSQLPKSVRHWLPVMDHPRTELTTVLNITHASRYEVVATGRRGSSELISVDEEVSTFSTNIPVPATSLGWAVGDLNLVTSTTASVERLTDEDAAIFERRADPQIYIHSELGQVESDLINDAASAFRHIQNDLNVEFPYRDLHIVVLEEDFWEVRNDAAGIVFVYKPQGNLVQQIQHGIIGQWIGTYLRPEQWADADAINILKADVAKRLFDFDILEPAEHKPYHWLSGSELSKWEQFLDTGELDLLLADFSQMKDRFYQENNMLLDWQTFAMKIYEHTGQPYFERYTPDEPEIEGAEDADPIVYTARIEWEEGANAAEIYFEAQHVERVVTELVTVQVEEITFNEARRHEVTFTGTEDGVVINVSPALENLLLTVEGRDDLFLEEEKSFYFWIHQLRNHDDAERRANAAYALSQFSENPDLQLALTDILMDESEPAVVAAILTAISKLTQGASGTDDRFMRYSTSEYPLAIQKAAVEALAYFEGNEMVINRLRNTIIQTSSKELRQSAIHSLDRVTDAARFGQIVEDLVTREPVLREVPLMIRLLAQKGEGERAVDLATTFVSDEFPHDIRKKILDIMLDIDQSSSNWMDRLPGLLSDRNPLIRKQAISALEKLNAQQRQEIVSAHLDNEHDARIRNAMK